MTKNFGLILKKGYVAAAQDEAMVRAINEIESKVDNPCDLWDIRVLPGVKYSRSGEDRVRDYNTLFAQLNSGEYTRVYIIMPSKNETDYFRESAYKFEDRNKSKNIKERFADEVHYRDERIYSVPTLDKGVDNYLYWFIAQTLPEKVEVFHIDLNEQPKAYSVTKEYFKPIAHDTELTQHERNWATVLGYEGEARQNIKWLMDNFDETELLTFANGLAANDTELLGATADAQVVICPECGEPTHASPCQHAFTDKVPVDIYSTEEEMQTFLTPVQLTCSHCGADLTACFDFDEPETDAEYEALVPREPNRSYTAWWTDPEYKQVHFK